MTPTRSRPHRLPLLLPTLLLVLTVSVSAAPERALPWREAGWSEREAAAHLLDRFAYGARPGDVDRVIALGLETWLEHQLAGALPDRDLDRRLRGLRSLELSLEEMTARYPPPALVLREAAAAGVIDRERLETARAEGETMEGRDGFRRELMAFARERGYRPQRELVGELITQKLLRARYSENQLTEVLVDFWFNHFNVSLTDGEVRPSLAAYERDAIRPHVSGTFEDMLVAVAKHPAMLHYLDNARSVAPEGVTTTLEHNLARFDGRRGRFGDRRGRFGDRSGRRGRFGNRNRGGDDDALRRAIEERRPQGLNENYARELMELHTLGVDGGYTQDDVVEVARAFTGWTFPAGGMRPEIERRIARARRLPAAGFVFEDSFIFRADAHDAEPKTILGRRYPGGRGVEDGMDVLAQLAAHPSTARHLARKLAVRFVADEPPETLVDQLAATFEATDGDLRAVVRALAYSPEFWDPATRGAKIKSPFELAVSALRALDAQVSDPRGTLEWVWRIGQPLYAYQAPTGYPDRAEAWVNTGSLLHRMNFGLALATGRIPGLAFDLAALNDHREPESLEAALGVYVPLLLPERDPADTLRRLEPVIRDPELASKIEAAAPDPEADYGELDDWDAGPFAGRRGQRTRALPPAVVDTRPLAQVVGVILGSPEFQRR